MTLAARAGWSTDMTRQYRKGNENSAVGTLLRRVVGIGLTWTALWTVFWTIAVTIVRLLHPDNIDPGKGLVAGTPLGTRRRRSRMAAHGAAMVVPAFITGAALSAPRTGHLNSAGQALIVLLSIQSPAPHLAVSETTVVRLAERAHAITRFAVARDILGDAGQA
jgi:hypothetical protein